MLDCSVFQKSPDNRIFILTRKLSLEKQQLYYGLSFCTVHFTKEVIKCSPNIGTNAKIVRLLDWAGRLTHVLRSYIRCKTPVSVSGSDAGSDWCYSVSSVLCLATNSNSELASDYSLYCCCCLQLMSSNVLTGWINADNLCWLPFSGLDFWLLYHNMVSDFFCYGVFVDYQMLTSGDD